MGQATCYIKLKDTEKELAIKVVGAHIAYGRPKNESVKALMKMHPRFSNNSNPSIACWRKIRPAAPAGMSGARV